MDADILNVADGGDEPFISKEQRQENGRKVAKIRRKDFYSDRVCRLKMEMGRFLKTAEKNEFYYSIVAKLKKAAENNPRLFGCYAYL